MALGGPRGIQGHRHLDAVAAVQQLGHGLDRRGAQPHVPRARPDGDDDVLQRRARTGSRRCGRPAPRCALSRASAARSVRRSASSMMMTRHGPTEGRSADMRGQLAGLLDLDRQPLGGDDGRRRRGCRRRAVRHSRHSPHPPAGTRGHAANARAATERPDPGGPVSSQAWVMAPGSATARWSVATAESCPMTSRQTLTASTPSVRSRASTAAWISSGARVPSTTR